MNDGNKKNNKLLFTIIVGVLTLIVAIVGATYAFFSVTVASGDYVTGSTGLGKDALKLEIQQVSAGDGILIPQSDDSIQGAVSGEIGNGTCIDDNDNTVCKVYSIKITNQSNVKMNVAGTLTLEAEYMPNLKWAKGTSATTGFPSDATGPFYSSFNTYITNVSTTTQTTDLANDVLQANGFPGNSMTYYVVIWISETNAAQGDTGAFGGTVDFYGYIQDDNGNNIQGITSAFTG